jgi:hypothetical protein
MVSVKTKHLKKFVRMLASFRNRLIGFFKKFRQADRDPVKTHGWTCFAHRVYEPFSPGKPAGGPGCIDF